MENGLAAPPCKIKPLVIRLYILSWMKLFATIFVERIVLYDAAANLHPSRDRLPVRRIRKEIGLDLWRVFWIRRRNVDCSARIRARDANIHSHAWIRIKLANSRI